MSRQFKILLEVKDLERRGHGKKRLHPKPEFRRLPSEIPVSGESI